MHETKLQLQLQQCQEVFSVFSLSSPTVTFLCSQVEVEVEVPPWTVCQRSHVFLIGPLPANT